ncbi:sulfatase-like hydrolase/transferase [Streptomyces sp. MAR4 CNX-425]|uniref:sulfatase-like hydrolase/transferase n=1 Tax=Streptomyces sp. MAR4 CNX-425 TaxID=3406343 RepID=UPI003B50B35A
MTTRRRFLAASAAGFGIAAVRPAPLAAAPGSPRGERPNIVLIVADDLGYGELGSYGQQVIHTPHLDRLAAEGMRFTAAYASAPVCAPSRASLLTGLHSGHARVRENPMRGIQPSIGPADTTVAELLRARGYRTGCIGKWGFGPNEPDQQSHPNHRGFEEFYGYLTHRHAHRYFPRYLWHNGRRVPLAGNGAGGRGTYAPEQFAARALEFIRTRAEEPFFLYLSPNVPHAPSAVPDTGEYSDMDWKPADKGHAAQVAHFDAMVGAVIRELYAHRVAEDTVVLVTSDNGRHEEGGVTPALFQREHPLRGYKRNLYEGGIRVPLIAWSPYRIRPRTVDRPTPHIDLLPTLAELGGAPAPRDIDGLSLAPLLTGTGPAPEHRFLYWYRNERASTPLARAADRDRIRRISEAVRAGDWKAVRFAPGKDRTVPDHRWQVELYNLADDPGETVDRAAEHPDIAARLVGIARREWRDTYARVPYGVTVEAPPYAAPGRALTVTATLHNGSDVPWTGARVELDVPEGWQARAATRRTRGRLAPGSEVVTRWRVTPPKDVPAGRWVLRARAATRAGGEPLTYRTRHALLTPPARGGYFGELPWLT